MIMPHAYALQRVRHLLVGGFGMLLILSFLPTTLFAATTNTPGRATFQVTTATYGGQYAPRHVLAIWVADANTNFVETLEKRAATRQQYLYRWIAARGTWTAVDGISTATINTHQSHTVTWDCKGTNGAVVPDGTYRFMVEFTEANAQGRWTTSSVPFVKSTLPLTNTPPNLANFTGMQIAFLPASHDIAALSIGPRIGYPNAIVPLRVVVTNLTDYSESFTVAISNVTTGTLIGTQQVASLGASASTTVTINWNTAGLSVGDYVLRATAGPLDSEAFTADNSVNGTITLRDPIHDVAVARVSGPAQVVVNSTVSLMVNVTNTGDFAEAVTVNLSDLTDGRAVGTATAPNLPSLSSVNLTIPYRATNAYLGYHVMEAIASTVSADVNLFNNTNTLTVPVSYGTTNVILVATGSVWRYYDAGIDLSKSAWDETIFYDGFWPAGKSPFGYGLTNIATTNNYGGNANAKFPTYYYRKNFYIDIMPTALNLRFRRDDGLVCYINGSEVLRNNMPAGPVTYSTLANVTVGGADSYSYTNFALTPSNLVVGANLLAVEVHQASATSSDISFDAELTAARPNFPIVHNVSIAQMTPAGDAITGDWLNVSVLVTNQGNVTETFTVYLRDLTSGQILGSQSVSNLVPNTTATAQITWRTIGATTGDHNLQAFTVVGGVTNLAGAGNATGVITSSGIGLAAVNATSSIGGSCGAVALTANRLLVGAGATLEIYDRSDAYEPVRLGSLRLPGLIESIAAAGTNAFVACGSAGLQIIDISNPAAPVHRSTFNSSGHAWDVAIAGILLYLADGSGGLRVLNVANPAVPVLTSAFYTEGPARAIALVGPTAYLLDQNKGLTVLNVSNPASITVRSIFGIDSGEALAVAGGLVYVTDGAGRFHVVNAVNPSALAAAGSIQLPTPGRAIALDGALAYVAAGDSGVCVVNVADSMAPAIIATNATPGVAQDIAQSFSLAYVADGFAGLRVVDLYWPQQPWIVADYVTGLRGADVVVTNNLAFVAAGEAGLQIFALSNAAAPQLVGSMFGATNARCVAVAGGLAFVGDGQFGVKVVEVTQPANPLLLGSYANTNLGFIRSIAASGARAVFTDGKTIGLLDAVNPSVPVLRASFATPAFAYAVTIAGDHAYVACGNHGVLILQIGASSLTSSGLFDTPGSATSVAITGTKALVAAGAAGWMILDIANPAAPVLLSSSSAQGPVFGLAAFGTTAALANGLNAIQLLNIATPVTPVPQQNLGPLCKALRVSVSDNVMVSAEEEAGLAIQQLGSEDNDGDGMPDGWEQQIVNANPNDAITSFADVLSGDDFDGDGLSNQQEFLAGTSPTDASSVFVVSCTAPPGGGNAQIRWSSVAGKLYTVYKSTNLLNGFSVLATDVPATAPLNTFTDPLPGGTAFYILSVR